MISNTFNRSILDTSGTLAPARISYLMLLLITMLLWNSSSFSQSFDFSKVISEHDTVIVHNHSEVYKDADSIIEFRDSNFYLITGTSESPEIMLVDFWMKTGEVIFKDSIVLSFDDFDPKTNKGKFVSFYENNKIKGYSIMEPFKGIKIIYNYYGELLSENEYSKLKTRDKLNGFQTYYDNGLAYMKEYYIYGKSLYCVEFLNENQEVRIYDEKGKKINQDQFNSLLQKLSK